jgi:hypothetical protein
MSISFPTSPTTGQQYTTPGGVTYTWTGSRWTAVLANLVTINSEINGANAAIVTANLGMKSYVDAQVTNLVSANIAGWNQLITFDNEIIAYADALNAIMLANVNAANSAITTALSNSEAYTQTYVNGIIDSLTTGAPKNLSDFANVAGNLATTTLSIDSLIQSLANTNANVLAANANIIASNSAVVAYVNGLNANMIGNVTAANTAIVTANTAMKAYVDYQVGTKLANISYGNLGNTLVTYLNSVMAANANVINSAWQSNVIGIITAVNILGANVNNFANRIDAANASISSATISLTNYTDTKVSTFTQLLESFIVSNLQIANTTVSTSNTAVVNYVNDLVTRSNSAVTSFVTQTANGLTSQIVNLNANIVSNINTLQTEINSLQSTGGYGNTNVAQFLPVYGGNITANSVTLSTLNVVGQTGPAVINSGSDIILNPTGWIVNMGPMVLVKYTRTQLLSSVANTAGAVAYDTTVNMPVYFNGANWVFFSNNNII